MPAFACQRCAQSYEIDQPPANAQVIPCPTCGGPLQPAEEQGQQKDVLQAALDELIERPGVRAFCTAVSSLLVHVAFGSILVLLIGVGGAIAAEEEKPPEISAGLVATDTPNDATGFEFEGKNNTNNEDAPKTADQIIDKPVGGDSSSDTPLALDKSSFQGTGIGERDVAGVGAAASGANVYGVIGRGKSAGGGGGRGGGGSGSGFGRGNRPGGGEVFGVGGLPGAKSIVYVVDRSGSMDTLGDFLKNELAKAVSKLNSTQKFNVIWFSEGDSFKLFNQMAPATEENKTRLNRHLTEIQFRGSTNPTSALTDALNFKPELIFCMTDGNFDAEFVDAISKKNAGRVRVNCIGFVLPGGEGHTNLQKLADQNKGTFRAIDAGKLTGSN